jgi:hypothetical protein
MLNWYRRLPASGKRPLFKIRHRNLLPHTMRKASGQNFIYQINWPENPMDNEPEDGVVIIPADQHGINAE